jgi:hypothetical protein
MNNYNMELDRGGSGAFFYSSACAFLLFVPGTLLLLFGKGATLLFPKPVIDFIFPVTIAPPEKLLLTTITGKFKVLGEVSLADFDRVDVFLQQFFVMSLLFSVAILLILMLQARARYLYPIPSRMTYLGFLKAAVILFLLREAEVCLLVGSAPVNFQGSRAPVTRLLMQTIAPEFLIIFTCGIAVVFWTAALCAYRGASLPGR